MPRSSRHKSHKQSKHSSKDVKDYLSDSEEDVKLKERNNTREDGASSKVSKESNHLVSGEKRKLSSSFQSKEGKEGKDLSYPGNGDASEEYGSSRRRKDKVEGISDGVDRWTAGADEKDDCGVMEKETRAESLRIDSEKGLKSRESKGSNDLKSKSSRRHESGTEKEDKGVASVLKGKEEENRSGSSRGDSKRKAEKDSGRREGRDSKDAKEKDRGLDRDSKKSQESKQEVETRINVDSVAKKHDSHVEDADKDRPAKRAKENTDLAILHEFRNAESEKELEKRIHRRREGSGDKDRYQDTREIDDKNVSSKGDRAKDGKYKDERYKAGNHGEKFEDNMGKDDSHGDDKYRDRPSADRDSRRRDDKYRDDSERESKRREDRYRDEGERDGKYREDGEKDVRLKDDKYRHVSDRSDRETKRRDDKYLEDGKDSRRDSRYIEDGERDDGVKDEKYREKNDRHKEEKRLEDYERDSELRDKRHGDDFGREKRVKETKYRDDRSFRDRSGDKSDTKNLREETSELYSRKSSIRDNSPSYDDRSRLRDVQGRKRTSDKDDYSDLRPRGLKDQRYDIEKRSTTNDARIDLVTDRGRSSSKYADVEATSVRSRHQGSPSSGPRATRDQYRQLKQDDSKFRDYAYEDLNGHGEASFKENGTAAGVTDKISSSRTTEKVVQKDDGLMGEPSAERRLKSDIRNSPRQLVDRSPSSTTADRRHFGRSDFRRSDDVEESGQRSSGFREARSYPSKEGRGTRDFASETRPGDEPFQGDGDTLSVSSPFPRNSHPSNSSKSFSHPPPPPFRVGIDSPQVFRSVEDDGRMKSNNRHRRIGDPNMVRVEGSPWKGLPSWPSPLPNGFVPFQHGPPVGFHPAMQQFPAPPMMGMRPSMELNHPGVPYPIPDGDRFSLHGHHLGWRTPMDDACPPQLHGWEANDSAISGESHLSGRQGWHHGRTLQGGRPWETSVDSWKSPKTVPSIGTQPAFEKDSNQSSHGMEDHVPPGQASEQAKIEQSDRSAECAEASHPSDIAKKIYVASDEVPEETNDVPKMSQKNDAPLCSVYLSRLDLSADLTDPELYSKCKDLVNVYGQKFDLENEKIEKILFLEAEEAKEKSTSRMLSGSLFPTINDSLLQKAISLYRNQKKELMTSYGKRAPSPVHKEDGLQSSPENPSLRDCEAEKVKSAAEEVHADALDLKQSLALENLVDVSSNLDQKLDEPVVTDNVVKSEDKERITSAEENWESDSKGQEIAPMETEESPDGGFPGETEMVIPPSDLPSNQLSDREDEAQIMPVTKYGPLLLSNVPKACEVDVPELTSESVNLSRIHHSPESTH